MTGLILFLVTIFVSGSSAGKKSDDMSKVLNSWKNRPELRLWPGTDTGTPTKVGIRMYVHSFHRTPLEEGTIAYEGYVGIQWTDPRLRYDKSLGRIVPDTDEILNTIWVPQIDYPRARRVEFASMGANLVMAIYPNGLVRVVRRFLIELDCYMKFNKFPFDNQTCTMQLYKLAALNYSFAGSAQSKRVFTISFPLSILGYVTSAVGHFYDEVQLRWLYHYVAPSEHAMFRLTNYSIINSITNYTDFTWQYMGIEFQITRNHGHYVSTWFVPTIFIIGLVYIAFWMPETYLLAKTLLTTALYLSYAWFMVSSVKEGPKVPYLTEFDKWFLVNLLFMTFAVIEVLVFYIVRKAVRGDVKVEDFQTKNEPGAAGGSPDALLFALDFKLRVMRGVTWGLRIAFPFAYILFLIIYFVMNKI